MFLGTLFIFVGSIFSGHAENWSTWRGPHGNGGIAKGDTPVEFSLTKNMKWKASLPGRGCSSPIVAEGKVFVTAPIDGKDGVIAYDLEKGEELWRATYGELTPGRGQRVGSSANSSPICDGERIYVYFKSGQLAALSLKGEKIWDLNVFQKYGENKLWWDNGTSPVLSGKNLIIAMMQTDAPSYLVALNAKTGEKVWKVARKFETGRESGDAYTTPHIVKRGDKEILICFGADHVTGHDTATGQQLWSCGGMNPKKLKAWRVIASSVMVDDVVVVPFARGKQVGAIRIGGKGDVTDTNWLWRKKMAGTDSSTPVARDGKIYLLCDRGKSRGTVTCFEAESGNILWKERLPKSAQTYYSSPVLVENKLYCAREDGVVFCAVIGEKGFERVTERAVGESVIASPAVAGDVLLLRGGAHLFCFAKN